MALLASGSSCAFFYRQPALPKRAAIEAAETPQTDEKFAALVQSADIIYFPTELLERASRTDPATRLVDALRRTENSFAIALDLISGEQQALLDRWGRRELSTDDLMSQLRLLGTARERENGRAFLGGAKDWSVRFLALRFPPNLQATAPSEAASNEFAAERISGHFRAHRDEKLLVFLHRRHLAKTDGVPHFVAQKIKARQLVLDSQPHRSPPAQLLAWSDRIDRVDRDGFPRRFEIVDGSPGTADDEL
jgi:hypothetical protein